MAVIAHGAHDWSDLAEEARRALEAAMQALGVDAAAEVAVVLTDDAQLHRLNLAHRGIDRATDVLSFPPVNVLDPDSASAYLGDILISVEYASVSAEAEGVDLREEVRLLAVHGLLHLLGYEDESESGAARMERVEVELGVRPADA